MNRIRGLESLEDLRAKLPEGPKRDGGQSTDGLPEVEAAYAEAFDALLTLWAAVGTAKKKMPKAVRDAHSVVSMRLRPLFETLPHKEAAAG